MQYAVELYFDKETENKLMDLAQRLADEKLSTKFLEWKTRPHLTLALTREDEDSIFYKANSLILHEFKKTSGEFVAIGLVKITFPVHEIYTTELCR